MRGRTSIAIVAWLATLAGPATSAEIDRARVVAAGASVLRVEAVRAAGGMDLGSGVALGDDKVVTACHVTEGASAVHVVRDSVRHAAKAQARRGDLDVCVLDVPGLGAPAVALGSARRLEPGQPVLALGYIAGAGLALSQGQVFSLHRLEGAPVLQVTNGFTSGASGGALFDDSMRLVGVLSFRLRGGEVHYFAAPADWIPPLLKDARGFRPVAPDQGPPPYWRRAPEARPAFLQAVELEQTGRWQALEALARRWTEEDTSDPEPWFLQGLALERQNQFVPAQEALERALGRDPDWLPALHRLGLVHVQQGDIARARHVLDQLRQRRSALAEDLQLALDRECAYPVSPLACTPATEPHS